MEVVPTKIPDVVLIKPRVFKDARGYFVETWSLARYRERHLPTHFVQDNLSHSKRGVVRGLHIQHPHGQGKLVSVAAGEVFDVAVDLRVGSPHFGHWVGVHLSAENQHQLYIPPGFAHGFCALQDDTVFTYKCTEPYHPEAEFGVLYNDPEIGIEWPVAGPLVSDKDAQFPKLSELSKDRLPTF